MNFREFIQAAFVNKAKPRRVPQPKYRYTHEGNQSHIHRLVKSGKKPRVVIVPIIRAHLIDYSKNARRARGELPPLN